MYLVFGKTFDSHQPPPALRPQRFYLGRMHPTFYGVSLLSLIHMDNCAAMVESSSVLRRFAGTGVSGDSGAIAALQRAPLAPTARTQQPRILAKSDLKTANCISACWLRMDLADMLWLGSFKPLG